MANRYFSGSKLCNWLRVKFGIDKPYALGWGKWDDWDAQCKKDHPVGYYLTETLPGFLEKIPETLIDPITNVRYWISNYKNGSHRLHSTLPVGKYHEFENVLLYSAFDGFANFIETELAYSHIAWSSKEERAKYKVPMLRRWRSMFTQKWRCKQAAIDHLKWEMTLDDPDLVEDGHCNPSQATAAREKMTLYVWWTTIRPARGECWVASGLQAHWNAMDEKYGEDWLKSKQTPAENRKYDKLSAANEALEESWIQEDEQMLIRLIKIRRALWT